MTELRNFVCIYNPYVADDPASASNYFYSETKCAKAEMDCVLPYANDDTPVHIVLFLSGSGHTAIHITLSKRGHTPCYSSYLTVDRQSLGRVTLSNREHTPCWLSLSNCGHTLGCITLSNRGHTLCWLSLSNCGHTAIHVTLSNRGHTPC